MAISRPATTFAGDVLRLVTGTGLAQLITIIAAPLLTRLYAPDAFGVATVFASLTGIIGVVACMRYELSIVLPDTDEEAANLLAVTLCCCLTTSFLVLVVVVVAAEGIANLLRVPALVPCLWLAPLAVLAHGTFSALNYWNTRSKQFSRLAIARVTSQIASTSGSIGAGASGHASGLAMVTANVAGQWVATSALALQIYRDEGRALIRQISPSRMLAGLARYRKFPLFSTWSALLNTLSWQAPVLMLGLFFSPAAVGLYALGFRILQMPMSLVGSAISQVFIQQAARAKSAGALPPLVEGLMDRLGSVALFPLLIIGIAGESLYASIFGQAWAEAGVYAQILSAWAFIWFVSSPMSTLFSVLERQEFGLKLNFFLLVTRVISLSVGGYFESIRLALLLFSATGILVYGYQIFALVRLADASPRRIVVNVGRTAKYALICILPAIVVSSVSDSTWLLFTAIAGCTVVFGIAISKKRPELWKRS